MAICVALGAGHSRIVRQTLVESLLLAALGGGAGILLAIWMIDLLVAWGPRDLPRLGEVSLDAGVLLYALGVTTLTGLLAGLAPSLQGVRLDLMGVLRDQGRAAGDRTGARLRRLLVLGEFSLAVMLLGGAALLIHSFLRLQSVNPGFDPGGLLTMRLTLPESRYGDDEARGRFFSEVLERAAGLPGVRETALTMALPPHLLVMTNPYTVEGRPIPPGQTPPAVPQVLISPGYFRALGVPLQRGRVFTDADIGGAPGVVIIDETMARRAFPGADPVGRRIRTGDPGPDAEWLTVVGVVGDVKYSGLETPPEPTIYSPYLQDRWWPSMYLILKTGSDPGGVAPAVRAAVHALDPELAVADLRTMDRLIHDSVAQPRFRATLVGAFAALAVLLAAAGAYGLLSHAVGQRTREMGIRMALGARPRDVLRLVIGEGMLLAASGILLGLAGGLGLNRALAGLLFGVSPTDLSTHLVVVGVMSAVAFAACWMPAHRATRIDPLVALRDE
jgi:putative ABC transport system permease protein